MKRRERSIKIRVSHGTRIICLGPLGMIDNEPENLYGDLTIYARRGREGYTFLFNGRHYFVRADSATVL